MSTAEQSQPSEIGLQEAAEQMAALMEGPAAESTSARKPQPPAPVDEAEAQADDVDETLSDDDEASSDEEDSSDDDATEEASEDDGEADEALDPDTLITVKIDGKTQQVTVKEAAEGYQRQADYSRKMAQLRQEAQTVQTVAQQVEQERAAYAQKLAILDQELRQLVPQEPDWARLHAEDPINFPLVEKQWRDYQQRLAMTAQERQMLAQRAAHGQNERLRVTVEEGRKELLERVPEWRDEAKWTQARSQLREYGRKIGYSDEELSQVYQPRDVLVLDKARRYDALMANRPKPQPAAPGPKPMRAGSVASTPKQTTEITRNKQRLAKTGRIQDAAKVFEGLI